MGRRVLEHPTSSGLKRLGLRPAAYVDIGSLWDVSNPGVQDIVTCTGTTGAVSYADNNQGQSCAAGTNTAHYFKEEFIDNSPSPRLSVGIGVNWVSPYGPLRFDLAKALLKQRGDDTKLFNFNVVTQF